MRVFNERKAAVEAGYSEKSAHVTGCRILKNDNVASYIRARMREAAMSTDEVLYHLAQIARGDMDDIIDSKGSIDIYKAREYGRTNLIKRVKTKSITTADKDGEGSDIFESETEAYDRMKALELIGKHLAMFTDVQKTLTWQDELITAIKTEAFTYAQVLHICAGDNGQASEIYARAGLSLPANVGAVSEVITLEAK